MTINRTGTGPAASTPERADQMSRSTDRTEAPLFPQAEEPSAPVVNEEAEADTKPVEAERKAPRVKSAISPAVPAAEAQDEGKDKKDRPTISDAKREKRAKIQPW
jgi:hypothetical protein